MPAPAPATPTPRNAHLALLAVQLCFASWAIAGKLALVRLGPRAILCFRVGCGSLIFLAIARVSTGRRLPRPSRAELGRLVVYSALGIIVNQLCFLYGLRETTATNATVLGTSIPAFTLLLAIVLGREAMNGTRVLGLAVACAGVLVVSKVDSFDLSDRHVRGNLLILLNSFSYSLFLVLVRDLRERFSPQVLVGYLFAIAALVLVPLGAPALVANAPHLPARAWLELAFIVAVPTIGAYSLNQYALRHAESSLVALYVYVQPLVVALLAYWVLDETPTWRTGVGGVLVFLGVWLASSRALVRWIVRDER